MVAVDADVDAEFAELAALVALVDALLALAAAAAASPAVWTTLVCIIAPNVAASP